jgi:hypothetical protein
MLHLIKHMQARSRDFSLQERQPEPPKSRLVFWTSRLQADCADNAAIGAHAAAATEYERFFDAIKVAHRHVSVRVL